jgi:hypothetical protein
MFLVYVLQNPMVDSTLDRPKTLRRGCNLTIRAIRPKDITRAKTVPGFFFGRNNIPLEDFTSRFQTRNRNGTGVIVSGGAGTWGARIPFHWCVFASHLHPVFLPFMHARPEIGSIRELANCCSHLREFRRIAFWWRCRAVDEQPIRGSCAAANSSWLRTWPAMMLSCASRRTSAKSSEPPKAPASKRTATDGF